MAKRSTLRWGRWLLQKSRQALKGSPFPSAVGIRSLGAHPRQSKRGFGSCGAQGPSPPSPLHRGSQFIQKEPGRRNVKRRHGAHREPAAASYSSWACPSSVLPSADLCAKHPVHTPPVITAAVTKAWAVSICIGCHKILFQCIFLQASCFLNSPPGPCGNLPEIDFSIFLTVLEVTSSLCAYKWLELSLFITVTDMCAN